MMQSGIKQNLSADGTIVDVIWVDSGPTKEWGHPVDDSGWKRYASYPLGVWDLEEFKQPDVVLVDDRFCPGCALATAFRTKKPVTVLIDDYKHRRQYHKIERFPGAPRLMGRMAEFDVVPMKPQADQLLEITGMMTRP